MNRNGREPDHDIWFGVQPPASIEHERATLGAAMTLRASFDAARRGLPGGWREFSTPAHQLLWNAICENYKRNADAPDATMLRDVLERRGNGRDVTWELVADCLNECPNAAAGSAYARVVHERYLARRLFALAFQMRQRTMDRRNDAAAIFRWLKGELAAVEKQL
jgi:replicative DNA helicase